MRNKKDKLEPLSLEEQAHNLDKLNRIAVMTLRNLLQNGSELTRLRASMWLLERMGSQNPVSDLKRNQFGELRIGFDEVED